VSQVDGEGYVLQDAFIEAIKKLYTEDSLKNYVEGLAPDCITAANARAKGRYNAQQIYFSIFPQNILPQLFHVPRTCCSILPISIYRQHSNLLQLIIHQLQNVM
jgi:hypothetical protein